MRFRKTGIFFVEVMIYIPLILLGYCCFMIYFTIHYHEVEPFFLIVFLMMLIVLASFPFTERYIIIDDDGITCRSRKKQIWSFKWFEIKELRWSRNRYPTISIILKEYDHTDIDNLQIIEQDLNFQYGRKAKQAISQYCKCPIVKQK